MDTAKHHHGGHRARLNQKVKENGIESLMPHEQLEWILFRVIPRANTNPIAHELLKTFGSLSAVFEADAEKLQRVKGIGESAAIFLTEIPTVLGIYKRSKMGVKPALSSSKDRIEFVCSLFEGRLYECFYVISLDTADRVLHYDLISEGTGTQTPVYKRKVVDSVIKNGAYSAIIAHNHPSGRVAPSAADLDMTADIFEALKTIDVNLVDHIIAGNGGDYFSFKENEVIFI